MPESTQQIPPVPVDVSKLTTFRCLMTEAEKRRVRIAIARTVPKVSHRDFIKAAIVFYCHTMEKQQVVPGLRGGKIK